MPVSGTTLKDPPFGEDLFHLKLEVINMRTPRWDKFRRLKSNLVRHEWQREQAKVKAIKEKQIAQREQYMQQREQNFSNVLEIADYYLPTIYQTFLAIEGDSTYTFDQIVALVQRDLQNRYMTMFAHGTVSNQWTKYEPKVIGDRELWQIDIKLGDTIIAHYTA